jgi:ribosomal protein S18 acetylase RimI-like enzyme
VESGADTQATISRIQACNISLGLNYGEVYAPSEGLEGVAIWLPPGHTRISTWGLMRSGILGILTVRQNRISVNTRVLKRAREYAEYAERIHRRHAPFPHWYLMMIGVKDAFRGQGYATRLIQPMLERCSQGKMPCYLETHNPRNLDIYGHFGFTVVEEGILPSSDIRHWAMLRIAE